MLKYLNYQLAAKDEKVIVLSNQTDESAGGGLYRITSAIYNSLPKIARQLFDHHY